MTNQLPPWQQPQQQPQQSPVPPWQQPQQQPQQSPVPPWQQPQQSPVPPWQQPQSPPGFPPKSFDKKSKRLPSQKKKLLLRTLLSIFVLLGVVTIITGVYFYITYVR
jgi:uncharacterized membrane protein